MLPTINEPASSILYIKPVSLVSFSTQSTWVKERPPRSQLPRRRQNHYVRMPIWPHIIANSHYAASVFKCLFCNHDKAVNVKLCVNFGHSTMDTLTGLIGSQ